MKDDWLNKKLEEKLDNYDSPMDLENAWESLQAKRQPPKKKNRFFFFWVIFGLLTMGVGGSYFFLNNEADNIANVIQEADHFSKNQNSHFEKTESSSPTPSISKKTNQNNADAIVSTETKTIQNTSKNITHKNQNYSDQKETKTKLKENVSFSKTKNNKVNTSIANLDFPKKSMPNLIFPKQDNQESNISIDSIVPQKTTQPIAVLFLPSLEMSLVNLSQKESYEKLNASYSGFYSSQLTEPRIAPVSIYPDKYLIISVGYGIRSKGKVLTGENPLDIISVNALYEKHFLNKRIYLKTGINFDQFVNKTKSTTQQNLTESRDNQLIAVNHYQNGTIENVFGTTNVSEIEMTTEKNFNKYRLISIPIIIGYDILSSYRSNLQIEAGFARSIFEFHSGKYFDLVDSDFKKRGVWQGVYGLNFNFKTSSRTNIFTSVKGNYHFNKIGKSDQLDMEKFRFHQIQFGLRFKL